MNILKDDFFKITNTMNNSVVSAIIKCLQNERNVELYKKWIAKEYNTNALDEKVQTRLNLILDLKDKLDRVASSEDRKQILTYLSRLLSAKYSGSKQSDTMISLTLDKLIYSFENKKPIIFTFGFGGYKNYNSPSFPEVDYAELFHMKYMTEFLFPIITTYEYGVIFEYESEEVSIQFNNVPQETTDKYTVSFKKLLKYFIRKIEEQNGIKLDYRLVIAREMYNPEELYEKMKEYYPSMQKEFDNLSKKEKEIWLKRAKSNFLINGTVDFSNLTEEKLNNKIKEAESIMNVF